MRMLDVTELKFKGVVACPACGKEFVFAYSDAKGHSSVPCIRCKRISMVDFETMTAKLIPPKNRKSVRAC